MAKPSDNINKLKETNEDVLADAVQTTDLEQSDAGSDARYLLGNTVFSVDGATPGNEWPTAQGVVTTSKTDTYFATQTYTPVGEDFDYYLQRKWDDTATPTDDTPVGDGSLNLTRWKYNSGAGKASYVNSQISLIHDDPNTDLAVRSNFYMNGGANDVSIEFSFDQLAQIAEFAGDDGNSSNQPGNKRFYIGIPLYYLTTQRQDNTNLEDTGSSSSPWLAYARITFLDGTDVFDIDARARTGATSFTQQYYAQNFSYKHFRIRFFNGTCYFYGKVNIGDSWTQEGTGVNTSAYPQERTYVKWGYSFHNTWVNGATWAVDYINVDYSQATVTWEVPVTGTWSGWKTIKDSSTVDAGAGVSGTFTTITSITVTDGIITDIQGT